MLFSSVVSAVSIRGSAAFAGLILTFIVARGFDATIAGKFFFFLAVANLLGIIATGGYSATALRELSKDLNTAKYAAAAILIFCSTRVVTLTVPLSVFGVVALRTAFQEGPNTFSVLHVPIVWGAVCFVSLAHLFSHSLQAFRSPKLAALLQKGMTSLLCVIFVLSLAPVISSATDLMAIYALSCAGASLIALACLAKLLRVQDKNMETVEIDRDSLTSTALNLWALVGASSLLQWGGVFVLGIFVVPEAVAQYSVAMRLALTLSMILLSINFVFSPHYVRAYERGDWPDMKRLVVSSTRMGWLFGAAIIAVLMIWAPNVTEIFGSDYSSDTSTILRILLLGQVANVAAGPVIFVLNMTGNDAAVRDVALVSSCVLVVFCLALAPYYGAYGVALASVASMISHNVCAIVKLRRHIGFSTFIALTKVSKPPS